MGAIPQGSASQCALFLLPQLGLKLLLGIETTEPAILLLARHWGLLLFLVGALLVYSAFTPAIRVPVLSVAIADVQNLGRTFDQIICTGVLHHLPDPDVGYCTPKIAPTLYPNCLNG
jgi:hypothetical protein